MGESTSQVWFFGTVGADVFAAWGQVIGAAGTLLAVVVALWIAVRDGRYRDAERRDNEAAHARFVSGARTSDPPRLTLSYTNYGSLPVTSVRLIAVSGRFGTTRSTDWSIGGSAEPYVLGAIAPGQTATTPPIAIHWPADADVDEATALYYPTVVFVDPNGRWWERTAHDQPRRLLSAPTEVLRLPTRPH
ncbi:hypothetical protein BLA60_04150 [Actinophytocola xinjiangensis]|uniref:Uncharacterized protein n=1 Tax=Actinophytocola xinjiangensis TaxID=485602 RepID=A0A7Z0WTN1_9PSEU|nr:hypothetical protein [Actinophytocola xinjiangensis]OLF14329.1 hypothetical protein BLA60_04150 [Actinophytocola xinjiangensis]